MLGHGTIGYGDLVKHYCSVTLQKGATVQAAQGRLSALCVFRRESILYGAFVWESRALNVPFRRFWPGQMSDWLKRPLSSDQLAYAEDDVRYLDEVYIGLGRIVALYYRSSTL